MKPLCRSFFHHAFAWIGLISLLILTAGCSSLQAPPFEGLAPVPEGKAHVYLYENWGLWESAAERTVSIQGNEMGKLVRGGYLLLEIDAGKPIVIRVVPTSSWGFAVMKSHGGERLFVEYEVIGNRSGRTLDIQDGFKFKKEDEAIKTLRHLNKMNRVPEQNP